MDWNVLRLPVLTMLILTLAAPVWAQPAESGQLLPVNGTELYVKRLGSGEPILVVHGGPMLDHGYLLPHLAPLAESYELIFYDQRLNGRSAPQVDPQSVRVATFVEDIEGIRAALGLERIHLLAHSWGGHLALRYALAHEDRLLSLVLLDPMAASSKLWQEEEKVIREGLTPEYNEKRQSILASEVMKTDPSQAIEQLLRLSFRIQFHDPSRVEQLALYVPEDYMERSRQLAGLQVDLKSYDFQEDLGKLKVPALLLFGADEPGAQIGGQPLHEALKGSKLVLIQDSGHFPFVEQPEATLQTVREFLAGLKKGPVSH